MNNLLLNTAPEPAGRALLAVRPATASSVPTTGAACFGAALFDVQLPVIENNAEGVTLPALAQPETSTRAIPARGIATDALPVTDEQTQEHNDEQPTPAQAIATVITFTVAAPIVAHLSKGVAATSVATVPSERGAACVAPPISFDTPTISADSATTLSASLPTSLAAAPVASGARAHSAVESLIINAEQVALQTSDAPTTFAASLPTLAMQPALTTSITHVAVPARPSLAEILGERLDVQILQRSEHAVIRLDPPSMGSIEITIRQDAGGVQVHMRASNAEVARQLHAIGDTLRQDLVQRQHGEVSVQVSDHSRDGDGRQRQRSALQYPNEPGRALREPGDDAETSGAFSLSAE
jgi:flagellar hook-length control protein FliK